MRLPALLLAVLLLAGLTETLWRVYSMAGMGALVATIVIFDIVLGTVIYRMLRSGKWTSDRGC